MSTALSLLQSSEVPQTRKGGRQAVNPNGCPRTYKPAVWLRMAIGASFARNRRPTASLVLAREPAKGDTATNMVPDSDALVSELYSPT